MKFKRFLITIFLAFFVYFTSNAYLNRLQDKKNIEDYGTEAGVTNKGKKVDNEILVLLVGVDASQNKENPEPTRTDTIMLCKINSKTGKVDLLSIPRDSRVKVREEFTKINHAHAYGGIELTLKTLRDFLGLDIDYYAEVNFDAVKNIVDGMGGVNYNVPNGVKIDEDNTHIKPGMNKMNGEDVLWYLRTRKIYENADLGRVNAQQQFLKAMVNEMVKKSESISMTSLVEAYFKDVKTNLPMATILDMTSKISNFSSDKFSTYTVPGTPKMIDGVSYYMPDFEKTWEIVDKVFSKYKLKNWSKDDSCYREYENTRYSDQEDISNEDYQNLNENHQQNQNDPEEDEYQQEDLTEDNPDMVDDRNYFDDDLNGFTNDN